MSALSSTGAEVAGGGAYEYDLEEHLLVHLHELLIPLLDFCSLLAGVRFVVVGGRGVVAVVLTPLNDLAENGLCNVRLRHSRVST